MFGGCPGYYEVVWEVKKDEDYLRLAVPLSFVFGKCESLTLNTIIEAIKDVGHKEVCFTSGFIGKEWKLLDVVDSNTMWNEGKLMEKMIIKIIQNRKK